MLLYYYSNVQWTDTERDNFVEVLLIFDYVSDVGTTMKIPANERPVLGTGLSMYKKVSEFLTTLVDCWLAIPNSGIQVSTKQVTIVGSLTVGIEPAPRLFQSMYRTAKPLRHYSFGTITVNSLPY